MLRLKVLVEMKLTLVGTRMCTPNDFHCFFQVTVKYTNDIMLHYSFKCLHKPLYGKDKSSSCHFSISSYNGLIVCMAVSLFMSVCHYPLAPAIVHAPRPQTLL